MSESPSALERAAARSLVEKYLRVKAGENVIVEAWDHTLPMSSALVDEVRRIGGGAFLAYESDDAWWRAIDRRQGKQLGSLSDPEWAALKAADVFIQSWGPADSARLAKLSQKKFDPWADAWFDRWYGIARSTGLRGGRMATGWVTDSRVRHWKADRERWRTSLLRACLEDPQAISKTGRRLAKSFTGKHRVRITHSNGTDVEVALAGAPPRVYDGFPHPGNRNYSQYDLMANLPDGRLAVALDARTAEGTIVATHTSYDEVWFPWDRYTGGRFEFSHGRLTAFSFTGGGSGFARRYARGKPGKDRTGYLRVGLHPTLRAVPYLEDHERGTVRLSVGGNSYLGGDNASDFVGWISVAGAEIAVDGVPVVRSGKIL